MILRHLFKTAFNPQATWPALRFNRSLYSTDDDKTLSDNNTQQLIPQDSQQIVEEVSDVGQTDESAVGAESKKSKKFVNKRSRKEDEGLDLPFVNSFLMIKRPEIDLNEFQNVTSQNFEDKLTEFSEKYEANIFAPLKGYEKRLNLSVENISKLKTTQPQENQESLLQYAKLGSYDDNPLKLLKYLLSSNNPGELKTIYQSQFFKNSFSAQFCQKICNHVLANPQDSFFLNFLYQNIQALNFSNRFPISIIKLPEIVEMVRYGELNEANPLKFYWFSINANQILRSELAINILREANKLYFNEINMENKLSQTSLFIVKQKLCVKIILEIISVVKSLEQFLCIWAATIVTMNRIHMISCEEGDLPQKLNFNDILLFENMKKREKSTYKEFFNHNLPKILYHHADPEIFQIYQRALKYSQSSPKDMNTHIYKGEGNQLNVDFSKNLKIEYRNIHDKFSLSYEFRVKQEEKRQIRVKESRLAETKVAAAIAKGEYKQALDYYFSTLIASEDEQIEFKRLVDKAKAQGFQSEHSEALFVFKQLSRKFTTHYNPNFSLNPKILHKSLFRPQGDRKRDKRGYLPQKAEDYQPQLDGKQTKAQNREKKQGFFGKPTSASFSTYNKQDQQEGVNKEEQQQHYAEYLKIARDAEESAGKVDNQNPTVSVFNFQKCSNFEEVGKQFEKNVNKITQQNLVDLLSREKNIPDVHSLDVLVKYYFLKRKCINTPNPDNMIVSFISSLGPIQKDYGEYLKQTFFPFALTDRMYSQMLYDQTIKFNRKEFKRICAHLLCYKTEFTNEIVRQICDICSKQKIGLTLLEIMHLVNTKKIKISYQSLKTISAGVQRYKNMESDLVQFLKGYSENTGTYLETALFQQYIANLTYSEQYEKLNAFLETLKFELRVREYKINQKLTPEQNIAAEAKYKKEQLARFNHENFVMLEIISQNFKPRTDVPNFITQMYQVYLGQKKGEFDSKDLGVGLLLNGRNEDEFINVLVRIKQNPQLNDNYVLKSGIKVLSIFSRRLKSHIEKVLSITIYSRKAQLTNENLTTLGYVFKDVDMPNAFSEFLEYLLIIKLQLTPEIKSQYYKIFNAITDDYSKNQISGLLDFIFNPKREKEREEFRAIKEQQQKKSKLLMELSKAQTEKTQKAEEEVASPKTVPKQDKISKKQKKKLKKEEKKGQPKAISPNKKAALEDTKLTYVPKLSNYHLRNRPLRIFLGTFMKKYEPLIEGEEVDIEKGKQGVNGVKIKGDKKRQK